MSKKIIDEVTLFFPNGLPGRKELEALISSTLTTFDESGASYLDQEKIKNIGEKVIIKTINIEGEEESITRKITVKIRKSGAYWEGEKNIENKLKKNILIIVD